MVGGVPGARGLDTGIAIANTTVDPYVAPVVTTKPQIGVCRISLIHSAGTASGEGTFTAMVTVTTGLVPAGSIYRKSMSTIPAFAGLTGYIIAVCDFQFGHGFAFISDIGVAGGNSTQGYVANVIPDPVLNGSRLPRSDGQAAVIGGGEGLGN